MKKINNFTSLSPGMSKPVKLIKKRDRSASSDQDDVDSDDYVSPLKRANKPRVDRDGDQEMDADYSLERANAENSDDFVVDQGQTREDVVSIDTVRHLVPPMFVWRAGRKPGSQLPHCRLILMRFATLDDVKSSKSERDSEFYQTYGNPNYGHVTGLISRSKKRRFRAAADEEDEGGYQEGENFDVRSRLKQRRHEAPLDLRTRIQNSARWQEIRASTRRWSDDELDRPTPTSKKELEEGELSPYSDLDEPVRNTVEKRVKKPFRMQMRADDVERKQKTRRRQNAALFGGGDQLRHRNEDSEEDAEEPGDSIVAERGQQNVELGYEEEKSDNNEAKERGQSPVDVRERLKKYRMKITVDNDEGGSESPQCSETDD